MVTIQNTVQYIDNVACVISTYYGLHDDTKPTNGVGNGSAFIEMDSGKIYFYDASEGGSGWIEWGGSNG